MRYIPTIGLEGHVQLKARSKMFCGCAGALPVMNDEGLKLTALTGLMLGCKVPEVCKFDGKNYFYSDMPRNDQITQFDEPICAK